MAHRTQKTAIAALTVEVKAGQREYVLIPDGEFRAADGSGRPDDVPVWRNSAAIAAGVIARAQRRAAKIVVDYEHQTLNAEKNGQPAPAAGRIDRASLRYEPGLGILGAIDWTPRAAQLIAGDEYSYLSPVFPYDTATGEVVALLHVALTNNPAIDLPAVALTAYPDFSTEEEPQMTLLQKLLASLGLADHPDETAALTAVAALKAKADSVDGLQTQVAALTAQKPDPAKFVAVETMQALQTQVAALTAEITGGKVAQIVDDALVAGKLLPAQKEWALDLGKANVAALTAYVEKTPANPALAAMQTNGVAPAGAGQGIAALTASDEKVMAQFGLTKEQFLASRQV